MMPIQSLGAGTIGSETPMPPLRAGNSPVDIAGELLGLSSEEMKTQLSSGMSLSDIAEAQGVSHEELIEALRDGMPPEMQGVANADEMLETIASQQGLGPAGGPPPPPARQGTETTGVLAGRITAAQELVVDVLGDLLKVDSEQVVSELRSGTSLAELLEQGGVDASELTSVLDVGALYDGRI